MYITNRLSTCLVVLRVEDVEVVLLEPPDLLDQHADGRERRDEQGEEDADGGGLERPHAAQAGELQEREGRRHLRFGIGFGLCLGWVGLVMEGVSEPG